MHNVLRATTRTSRLNWNAVLARKNSTNTPAGINPDLLQIESSIQPRTPPPAEKLVFGRTFTDHMLAIPWTQAAGWGPPRIQPYGPLPLEPSATVFHYAQCAFEGMKAYLTSDKRITMFRPDMNMARFNNSVARIALPTFDGDALLTLIKKLVYTDRHWIPTEPGHSLYIRPTMIGTQRAIGVTPPEEALLFVICSPVGPYYPQGFKPVALEGTSEYIRAAPGGTGAYKLGLNYAPGVLPQRLAIQNGYVQNLWLHGPEHYLTEVGTMNLFIVFKHPDGTTELCTPPLDGMILPGVTRDSIISLARDHISGKNPIKGLPEKLVLKERLVTMAEVKKAVADGSLTELFGSGTAAVISVVNRIGYQGEDVHIPTGPKGTGPIANVMWEELVGRQEGRIKSDWTVYVDE